MEQIILVSLYVIFAVTGSTLLKFGAGESLKTLFMVPVINLKITLFTFLGFITYGISFLLYTILLGKYELSYISPLTVGIVYIALMITAFVFFKEPFRFTKICGSLLIFTGIMMMLIKK